MPQFDKINLLSQIFWVLFIFLGFYLIVVKNYLPLFGKVLKTRKKILNLERQLGDSFIKTQQTTSILSDLLVLTNLNSLRLNLSKNYNSGCLWSILEIKNVSLKKSSHWYYNSLNFFVSPNLNLLSQKIINKNFISSSSSNIK